MEEFAARLVHALVGMRAKVVALSLREVRGQALGAVAVVIAQRRRERRRGNAVQHGLGYDLAPICLSLFDLLAKERVEQEVVEIRRIVKRFFYLAKEYAADDAAAFGKCPPL